MGQAESVEEGDPYPLGLLQANLNRHASELKQIARLSYDKFLESIEELNRLTSSFTDSHGKKLIFSVKPGSEDTGFLWKATVRICCTKVDTRTGIADASRLMDMKQYIHLYNEIRQQAAAATLENTNAAQAALSASVILSDIDKCKSPDDENECVICMDRKAEIILSCTHSYCEQCIDEWHLTQNTCPICRARVSTKDDSWVLTEKPDETEMAYETSSYLVGLAERSGRPVDGDT